MGPVARCSSPEGCRGALAPMFNEKTKEIEDYYCTNCGIVWDRLESDDQGQHGAGQKGRIAEQDELKRRETEYRKTIANYEDVIRRITNLVESDNTKLAKAIKAELDGTADVEEDEDEPEVQYTDISEDEPAGDAA